MKKFDSHISYSIKKIVPPKINLFNKIFKPIKIKYFTKYNVNIFCWLFTDSQIVKREDFLFYNNPINDKELVYIADNDMYNFDGQIIEYENDIPIYTEVYFDINNINNEYNRILFSLNLFHDNPQKLNFQDLVINFKIVTNNNQVYQKEIKIISNCSFFDFLELKKINNSWLISDNIVSPYNTLERAITNRTIETN